MILLKSLEDLGVLIDGVKEKQEKNKKADFLELCCYL